MAALNGDDPDTSHDIDRDTGPTGRTRRRVLVRNTFWNQGAQVARMLSLFALLPLIASKLGETESGILFLAISFTAYFGVLDSSFSQPLIKFVAEHRARGEEDELRAVVRTVFRVFVLVGITAAALLTLAATAGMEILKIPPSETTVARSTLLVAAAASIVTWPVTTFDNVLRGVQRYDLVSKVSLGVTATSFTGQTIAVVNGARPPVLIGIAMASLAAGGLVSRALARRVVPEMRRGPGAPSRVYRRVFRFAGAFLLMGLSELVIYQFDRTLVSASAGVAAVTLYEFAARFHKVPRDIHAIAVSAAMPAAAELDAAGEREKLASLLVEGARLTVAVVLPVTVAILALARPITKSYAPENSYWPLVIFVSYWVVNANTGIASVILAGMGKLKVLLVYSYVVAGLNLVLSLLLARRFGVAGVVGGTSLAYVVSFPFFLAISLRAVGVGLWPFARRAWIPAYPMALVLWGLLYSAGRILEAWQSSFLIVVAVGGVGVLAYFCCFWMFAMSRAERDDFTKALIGERGAPEAEELSQA